MRNQHTTKEFREAIEDARRKQEATELIRSYQQGFGKPIITAEWKGLRLVAVSNRIKYSPNWRWFTDFLLDHLKDCIGREWAKEAQNRSLDHPLFRWLRKMNEAAEPMRAAGVTEFQHDSVGFLTSVFRLGYALYLIEHHDQLDESIIRRLRLPSQFVAAYYETLIAAAFAVSGAKIAMAERLGQSSKSPEFWATCRSGKRFAIEAKCKSNWKSPADPQDESFRAELRQWLRDQIYKASSKK